MPGTEPWGSALEHTGGIGSKFDTIFGSDPWSKFWNKFDHQFDPTKKLGNPIGEGCSKKKTEEQTDPSKEQQKQPQMNFGEKAKKEVVSDHTKQVLQDALNKSGNSSATISSTKRSPYDQARIMYDNLKTQGVDKQKKLYGNFGDQVIDVYVSSKKAGKTGEAIIKDMASKISNLGPANITKHCGDFSVLQVIDVAPTSITNKQAFVEALKADPRISKIITPPSDPAYHIEIPQPKK